MNTALVMIGDPVVEQVLVGSLRSAAFHAVCAGDLDEARRVAAQLHPDVVIVDIDRFDAAEITIEPDGSGRWGGRTGPVPLIVLTADPSAARAAARPADRPFHCNPKPMRPRDVVAAAVRLVRRSSTRLRDARWSGVIRRGPVELDMDRFTMTVDLDGGRVPLGLGPTATRLMARLLQRSGAVCGRDDLLAEVWPDDPTVTLRTVDQNIHRLRMTLRQVGLADTIRTIDGQGYSFVPPPERAPASPPARAALESDTDSALP